MVGCEVCGSRDQFLYECEHCQGKFCTAHSDPVAHVCGAADIEGTVFGTEGERSRAEQHPAENDSGASSLSLPTPQWSNVAAWMPSTKVVLVVAAILVLAGGLLGAYAIFGTNFADVLPSELAGGSDGRAANGLTEDSNSSVNRTAVERLLFERLNTFRTTRGGSALTYDLLLAEIASYHSRDMAERNYTDHVAPGGESVQDRFNGFGYTCDDAGEMILFTHYRRDIAIGNGTIRFENESELATGVVELWRRSPAHREALLTPAWSAVGFGVHLTDDNRVFVTLNAC